MRQAIVFARIFDYSAEGAEPGSLRFTLEYRQLQAPAAHGKLVYVSNTMVDDDTLQDELKLAVARHLNAVQPGLGCRARDVIGCGV